MAVLSEEQHAYVTSEFTGDTKLLATAGSGKTFCIIKRIENLVKRGSYAPMNIFMLTFSKNAKDDFRRKVVKYGAHDSMFRENVYTIDSFAWHVFGEDVAKRIDVSLLSYALMDELQTRDSQDLVSSYPLLRALRCVFVDEAQDLNDVQYTILKLFKQHLGDALAVHMVGDPNQNIYQFRAASDKYLTGFEARTFRLTTNYRSFSHIVDFCSHLRPYNDAPCTASHDQATKMAVTFYAYDSHTVFEKSLVGALQSLIAKRIPLHKCAILAPTRGYIRNPFGVARYRGLCYIANILYNHKIAFSQFYTDVAEDDFFESSKVKYVPTKDHINLMTYTSSKGLEWDYVVLVDANAFLISRMGYDADKYAAEQYLLYVASSRARKNLMIFSRARYCNPWFKEVPVEQYRVAKHSLHMFGFFDESQLYSSTDDQQQRQHSAQQSSQACIHSPYSVVSCLNMAQLYRINKLVEDRVTTVQVTPQPDSVSAAAVANRNTAAEHEARRDYSKQFLTHLFFVHLVDGCLDEAHPFVVDIHNLVTQSNVVVCPNERVLIWYFENRNAFTWDLFNARRATMDQRVVAFIDSAFSQDHPFHSYTLVDRFHDMYLNSSMDFIREVYGSYKQQPKDVKTLLHMTRVCYAIKTTHYFYVKQHDAFFTETAAEPEELLDQVRRTIDALRCEFGADAAKECQLNKYCRNEELNMFFFHNVVAGLNFDARSKHSLSIRYLLRGLLRHIALLQQPLGGGVSRVDQTCEFLTLQVQPLALYKTSVKLSHDDIECLLACITHASRSASSTA